MHRFRILLFDFRQFAFAFPICFSQIKWNIHYIYEWILYKESASQDPICGTCKTIEACLIFFGRCKFFFFISKLGKKTQNQKNNVMKEFWSFFFVKIFLCLFPPSQHFWRRLVLPIYFVIVGQWNVRLFVSFFIFRSEFVWTIRYGTLIHLKLLRMCST